MGRLDKPGVISGIFGTEPEIEQLRNDLAFLAWFLYGDPAHRSPRDYERLWELAESEIGVRRR